MISVCKRILNAVTAFAVAVSLATTAVAAERTVYYHADALGSPVAATNEAGEVLWRETYRPYGEPQERRVGSAAQPISYTGKPYDDDTGLSYLGARFYNPSIGRFMAMDPAGFEEGDIQSFNKYAYANNNPYKFVDPDGKEIVPSKNANIVAGIEKARRSPEIAAFMKKADDHTGKITFKNFSEAPDEIKDAAENPAGAGPVDLVAADQNKPTDAVIYLDPTDEFRVHTTHGSRPTPIEFVVGHEIIHALDFLNGTRPRGRNSNFGNHKQSEVKARRIENKWRKGRLPLRKVPGRGGRIF